MMTKRFIPVAAPMLVGNEKTYVMDCIKSTRISSRGDYIEKFESAFSNFCGVKHALSCCNGTAALHLALMALGVGAGDEIIVPTLTFIATVNAVTYCGARPIFVDSENLTWNMDPALIEACITPRTKGIIVVHLYGHPVDMDPIIDMARRKNLFIIEDAAEAHGAEYKRRKVGSIGDIATFSFYGNKIITTGEGGMVVTNNDILARKVKRLKEQGIDPNKRYWFLTIGYNYRMTNICAAIGLAQLEKVKWHLNRYQEIASWYCKELKDNPDFTIQFTKEWAKHAHWMFSVLINDKIPITRDEIIAYLNNNGIETRPIFYPIHILPPYSALSHKDDFPVSEQIARRGITLPTWAGLKRKDISYICSNLIDCINSNDKRKL